MAILKKKWFIFLLIIIALVVFESLVIQIPLSKRAIAIGIGLDAVGEEVELSAQIIVPAKNNTESEYRVFSAKGASVEQASANLQNEMGATPSFAHTLVVIVGIDFVGKKMFDSFRTFVSSTMISDNALVGVSMEQSAKDTLRAKMTVNTTLPYNMQNSMLASEKPVGQSVVKVKDYFRDFYQMGGCTYFPIVSIVESDADEEPATAKQSCEKSLLKNGSKYIRMADDTGQAGQKEKKEFILFLDKAVIVDKNFNKLFLSAEETRGLTIVLQKHKAGNFNVLNKRGEKNIYSVENSSTKLEVKEEKVTFSVNLVVENLSHSAIAEKPDNMLGASEKEQISAEVSSWIISAFENGRKNNMDIFNVGEKYYVKYGEKWKAANENSYLAKIIPNVEVKIKTK